VLDLAVEGLDQRLEAVTDPVSLGERRMGGRFRLLLLLQIEAGVFFGMVGHSEGPFVFTADD
jgi:hypothetical protein